MSDQRLVKFDRTILFKSPITFNQYINQLRIEINSAKKLEDVLPLLNKAPGVIISEIYSNLPPKEKKMFDELYKESKDLKGKVASILNKHLPKHQAQIDELRNIISEVRKKFHDVSLEQRLDFSSTKEFFNHITKLKLVDSDDRIYYHLAKTAIEGEDYNRAWRYLEKITNQTPEVLYEKGRVAGRKGKPVEATQLIMSAIKKGYSDDAVWSELGVSLRKSNFEDALKFTEEMLLQGFDKARVWVVRGQILGKEGKNKEYLACAEQAIKENPKLAWAWNNKGLALHKLGKPEEAIKCYDKALEIKPDYYEARENKKRAVKEVANRYYYPKVGYFKVE